MKAIRLTLAPRVLVVLALIGVLASGCTVRLIGDYDDTIDKGVTDIQQRAESYFSKLSSTLSTPVDQNFHDDIRARLIVLETRSASLPKYSIIADQIALLQKTFVDFQQADLSTKRPLVVDPSTGKPPLVGDSESAITSSVESILKIELALKRGDSPAVGTATPKQK